MSTKHDGTDVIAPYSMLRELGLLIKDVTAKDKVACAEVSHKLIVGFFDIPPEI